MRYRRLQRDAARFEFCMDDRREDAFEKMIELKREQCRRTGVYDAFSVNWTRGVLEGDVEIFLSKRRGCYLIKPDGSIAQGQCGGSPSCSWG